MNDSPVQILSERLLMVAYRREQPPVVTVAVKLKRFRSADGQKNEIILGERRTPGRCDETLTVPFETEADARTWFETETSEGSWGAHSTPEDRH